MKSVKMQKQQSSKNMDKIQRQRHLKMKKAKRNTNIIKKQREVRRQKMQDIKAATMYSAKEEYDNRLRGEYEMRVQEERRVRNFFYFFFVFSFSSLLYHFLRQCALYSNQSHTYLQLQELERKERELMERLTRQTSIDISDGI